MPHTGYSEGTVEEVYEILDSIIDDARKAFDQMGQYNAELENFIQESALGGEISVEEGVKIDNTLRDLRELTKKFKASMAMAAKAAFLIFERLFHYVFILVGFLYCLTPNDNEDANRDFWSHFANTIFTG